MIIIFETAAQYVKIRNIRILFLQTMKEVLMI